MTVAFAIDVRGMTKRFGALTAVDHIDLQVAAGTVFGFLGPNGSGKTTFIRMLCGLLRPDEGEGSCLGFNVRTESDLIKRHVGYMTQRFSYYEDLTVRENLNFVARMYELPNKDEAVAQTLARMGLERRQHQLAGNLSGGWKQRLALAACMIHNPQLLLLDEPTAGVDPKARREFWEEIFKLSAEGLTLLIATHYMDEAERCHRLAFVSEGKLLAEGTVPEVVQRSGLTTWVVSGPDLPRLVVKLRDTPGVDQAVPFGNTLRVSGANSAALESVLTPYSRAGYDVQRIGPGLEDVFIHLVSQVGTRAVGNEAR